MVDVQGRLRQNLIFWQQTLEAPNSVLEWIQIGYKLPLRYPPDRFSQSNHKSTLTHKSFVSEAVTELLANRCVKQVAEKPYICSPLSRSECQRQTTLGPKLEVFESVFKPSEI